jgi:hypothetical protein
MRLGMPEPEQLSLCRRIRARAQPISKLPVNPQVHAQQISQIQETQHLLLQELDAVSSLAQRVLRAKAAAT